MQAFSGLLFFIAGFFLGAILFIYPPFKKKKSNSYKNMEDFFRNTQRSALADLRLRNPERCKVFGHSVKEMPLAFWSTAVAGECGEMCNIIKKKLRGDVIKDFHGQVGREAADIVIYLDLLCTFMGISLEEFIILKFNEVSEKSGSLIKL